MSVVIETTLGDITVDLYLEQRPVTCLNFLKLCKKKYYNFNLFHTIRNGFIAQTGDPSGEGSGGESIFGLLEGPEKRFFSGEKMPKIRHSNAGLLSMVCTGDMMVGSQFFFTLAPDLDSLDGVHCVIGEVTEGQEVLRKLNEVICDENHRPYQDVRITHTVILEDPYNDPSGFCAPSRSPSPSAERLKGGRIGPDEDLDESQGKTAQEIQEMIEEKEAKARATILEIVGDLPDADIAPPENVLFVCKLNPVTTDEDLEIIFSRFGKIVSCEVIRDKKTGDSLQYAFIEFSDKKSCEDAYFKMDNVLIDDRRIHVDFSQSVSKMRWLGKGRGVQHFNDDEIKENQHKFKQKQNRDLERDKFSNRHHDRNEGERPRNSHHHNEKYREREEKRDKRKQNESDRKHNKPRSRSRSAEKSSNNKEKERPRDRESNSYRNYDNTNNTRHCDKTDNNKQYKSHNREKDKYRETNSSSSRHRSPSGNIELIKQRDEKCDRYVKPLEKDMKSRSEKNHHIKEKEQSKKEWKLGTDNVNNRKRPRSNSRDESKGKKLHKESEREVKKSNRLRKEVENQNNVRTPSPATKTLSKKDKSKKVIVKNKKTVKNVRNSEKKKRKPSTSSSDSDTTDSSSSSTESSSSSSGSDRKRRKRKRVRKHSSSSSDSSDSSSTSSSSESSTESSSSSSESDKDRKKNNKPKKKVVKKIRKK